MNLVLLALSTDEIMKFVMLGGVGLVVYFLMLRPQQQKQKEAKKMQESLSIGDKVVTAGGFYGKVVTTGETTVIIELAKGANAKIERSSIVSVEAKS